MRKHLDQGVPNVQTNPDFLDVQLCEQLSLRISSETELILPDVLDVNGRTIS